MFMGMRMPPTLALNLDADFNMPTSTKTQQEMAEGKRIQDRFARLALIQEWVQAKKIKVMPAAGARVPIYGVGDVTFEDNCALGDFPSERLIANILLAVEFAQRDERQGVS